MPVQQAYNLGDFIRELEKINNQELPVYMDYCKFKPYNFCSYRGDYADLALICFDTHAAPLTVTKLLNLAKQCVGNVFTGYKGGDYLMSEMTTLWVVPDPSLSSDTAIYDITIEEDSHVVIHTFFRPYSKK